MECMNELEDLSEQDFESIRKAIQDKESDNLRDFNHRIVNELSKMGPKALKEFYQLESSFPMDEDSPIGQLLASNEVDLNYNDGEESCPLFGIDYTEADNSTNDFLSVKFNKEKEVAQKFSDADSTNVSHDSCLFDVLKTTIRRLEQYIAITLGKPIISLPVEDVRRLSQALQSPRSILSISHTKALRAMVKLTYKLEAQSRHPEMIDLYSQLIHFLQRQKESKRAFGRPIDSQVQNRICQLYVEHQFLDKVRQELRISHPEWKDEGNGWMKWRLEHVMRLSLRKLEAVLAEMEEKEFIPILKENQRRMLIHCQEAHQSRIELVRFYLQQDCDIPDLLSLTKCIAESLKKIQKRTQKGTNKTSQRNLRSAIQEQQDIEEEEQQEESVSSSQIRAHRYRSKRKAREQRPQETKRRTHGTSKHEKKKQLTLQQAYGRSEQTPKPTHRRQARPSSKMPSFWQDDSFIEQIARSINKEMKLSKKR